MAPSKPLEAATEGAAVAAQAAAVVEGAAHIPLPPHEDTPLGQAVAAGFLVAVVVEEAPEAATGGQRAVGAMEGSGTAVMEGE